VLDAQRASIMMRCRAASSNCPLGAGLSSGDRSDGSWRVAAAQPPSEFQARVNAKNASRPLARAGRLIELSIH
jgi:hypothetical protein